MPLAQKAFKTHVLILVVAIVFVLSIGTVIFSYLENLSLIDALYFVTATATTIGYGDITPKTDIGKIVTIIYAMSIIPFVLYLFSLMAKFETEQMYKKIHSLERKQEMEEEDIEAADKKIAEQHRKIKEQEAEIQAQEEKLKKQTKITKEQEKELTVQERELSVVEDIVENALEPKPVPKEKPARKKSRK